MDVFKAARKRLTPSMLVAIAAAVFAFAGVGYAAATINGADIKKRSIPGDRIVGHTVGLFDLGPKVRAQLDRAGAPDYAGPNWGIVTRNTVGSPVADLRSGPHVFGAAGHPPNGTGSLGIEVAATEKVAFGDEVDFLGHPVSGLSQVGFRVFQTAENANGHAANMPNITIEIVPHVASQLYTSMVWLPGPAPVTNQWSGYIDATTTGTWYFTNATVATTTGCGVNDSCSFSQAKAALASNNDGNGAAAILTVAVSKGTDNAWTGAVDGLRINGTTYDFETDGVHSVATP